MASSVITIEVKAARWLRYLYVPLLLFTIRFCRLFFNAEAEPNWDKVNRAVSAGIKIKRTTCNGTNRTQ